MAVCSSRPSIDASMSERARARPSPISRPGRQCSATTASRRSGRRFLLLRRPGVNDEARARLADAMPCTRDGRSSSAVSRRPESFPTTTTFSTDFCHDGRKRRSEVCGEFRFRAPRLMPSCTQDAQNSAFPKVGEWSLAPCPASHPLPPTCGGPGCQTPTAPAHRDREDFGRASSPLLSLQPLLVVAPSCVAHGRATRSPVRCNPASRRVAVVGRP